MDAAPIREVRLTGPAKIGGRWRQPGDVVPVDAEVFSQLRAAGVIAPDAELAGVAGEAGAEVITLTRAEFDAQLAAAAKALADLALDAAIDAAIAEVVAERDAALTRAEAAEARVAEIAGAAAETPPRAAAQDAPPASDPAPPKRASGKKG